MGSDNSLSQRTGLNASRIVQPLAALLAAFALAFVILGSLTPFSVDVSEMRRMGLSAIGHLGWPHSDLRDVVINIGVYMPIGFAFWILFTIRCSRSTALSITILAGTMLSFTLETLQQFVATRYPSWIDVMVNAGGTTIGAALAWLATLVFVGVVSRQSTSMTRSIPAKANANT